MTRVATETCIRGMSADLVAMCPADARVDAATAATAATPGGRPSFGAA
jgi:hypothetical protein